MAEEDEFSDFEDLSEMEKDDLLNQLDVVDSWIDEEGSEGENQYSDEINKNEETKISNDNSNHSEKEKKHVSEIIEKDEIDNKIVIMCEIDKPLEIKEKKKTDDKDKKIIIKKNEIDDKVKKNESDGKVKKNESDGKDKKNESDGKDKKNESDDKDKKNIIKKNESDDKDKKNIIKKNESNDEKKESYDEKKESYDEKNETYIEKKESYDEKKEQSESRDRDFIISDEKDNEISQKTQDKELDPSKALDILKGSDKESIRSDRERERMRDRERRDRRRDSPDRRRAISPIRRRDISPTRRRDMSPIKRRDISPNRRRDISPIRRRDMSPIRRRDISPNRRRDLISPDRSHDRHRSPRLSPFNRRDYRSPPRERRRPRSRELDRDVRRFDNYNTSYEMRRTNNRGHSRSPFKSLSPRERRFRREPSYSSYDDISLSPSSYDDISLSPSPEKSHEKQIEKPYSTRESENRYPSSRDPESRYPSSREPENRFSSSKGPENRFSSNEPTHSKMEIELVRRGDLNKTPFAREKRVPFLVEIQRQLTDPAQQASHIYQNEQIHSYPQQMQVDNQQYSNVNFQTYGQGEFYSSNASGYPGMPNSMNVYPQPVPPPVPLPVPPPSQYPFVPYSQSVDNTPKSSFSFRNPQIPEAPPPPDISKSSSSLPIESEPPDPEVLIFRCEEALKTFRSDSRLRQSSGCFRHAWLPIQNIPFHMSRSPLLRFGHGRLNFNEPEHYLKIEKLATAVEEEKLRRESCLECIQKKLNRSENFSQTDFAPQNDAEVQVDLNHSQSYNFVNFESRLRRDPAPLPGFSSMPQEAAPAGPSNRSPVALDHPSWHHEGTTRREELEWQRQNQLAQQNITPPNQEFMQRQELMNSKNIRNEENTFQSRFAQERDNQMFFNPLNNKKSNEMFRRPINPWGNNSEFPRSDQDDRMNKGKPTPLLEDPIILPPDLRGNLKRHQPNRDSGRSPRGRGGGNPPPSRRRRIRGTREDKKKL